MAGDAPYSSEMGFPLRALSPPPKWRCQPTSDTVFKASIFKTRGPGKRSRVWLLIKSLSLRYYMMGDCVQVNHLGI